MKHGPKRATAIWSAVGCNGDGEGYLNLFLKIDEVV